MSIQSFTSGQTLTSAQMNALQENDYNQTVSTKTASYTLVAADKGTRVVMNAAGATTITVNTSLFSAGDTLYLQNIGAGVCTVTAGTATVSSAGPLAIPQYGSGTLYFTSAGVAIYFPSAVTASASGLTLISATTMSGAAVSITNCFSATYRNYLIIGDSITGMTAGYELEAQLGVSSTYTTANYTQENFGGGTSTLSRMTIATANTNQGFSLNLYAPNASATTMFIAMSVSNSNTGRLQMGYQTDSTAFTDIRFQPQSGSTNFSGGTVRIYGYANS